MTYGLPYQGSKNAIAQWVVDHLPPAARLYDLFAGGCAVTHAALLSGKFGEVHANDIQGDVLQLFIDAINGRYLDEKRWISREEFQLFKNHDTYIRLCWSFSNNCEDYFCDKKYETIKRIMWKITFADSRSDKLNACTELLRAFVKLANSDTLVKEHILRGGDSLFRLEPYARLNRINMLRKMRQRPTISSEDYRNVKIMADSVIYCDLPYRNTRGFITGSFDHDAFYEWALSQTQLVVISEYSMPDDFVEIASTAKMSLLSASGNTKVTEHLYVPRPQAAEYRKPGQLF